MYIFVLEDSPERHLRFRSALVEHKLDMVETVEDGRKLMDKKYDLIFLDHDLGGEVFVKSGEGTGYEMAQYIAQSVNKETPTIIHSLNHAGARSISFVLPHAEIIPFIYLDIELEVKKKSKLKNEFA